MKPLDFKSSIKKSNSDFINYVAPLVESTFNITIYNIENDPHPLLKLLDMNAGWDYAAVHPNGGITGIASRLQWTSNKSFNTFTIRKERDSKATTEYQKRKDSILKESTYPQWTIQTYIDRDTKEVIGMAICKTSQLINYITEGKAQENRTGRNQIGQASFYVIPWQAYQNDGNHIYIYTKD